MDFRSSIGMARAAPKGQSSQKGSIAGGKAFGEPARKGPDSTRLIERNAPENAPSAAQQDPVDPFSLGQKRNGQRTVEESPSGESSNMTLRPYD